MNSFRVGGHRGLLEGLSKCGVGVACASNILARGTILQSQGSFSNHLTRAGANDVDSEQTIGLGVGKHLHHTVRVKVGLRPGVGAEGESADGVLGTGLLQVLLGLADPGDLGVRVHDRGDAAIVDVAITLLDELDSCDTLLLCLVRKHGAESGVSDAANVGELGTILRVNDDTSTVIKLKANVLEAQTSGVWATSNGNQDNVGIELSSLSASTREKRIRKRPGWPGSWVT